MDPSYIKQYEDFEFHHWWFVARRELICDWMDRYVVADSGREPRWLDIGCGTGVLLDSYWKIKQKMGIERDAQSVRLARLKNLDVRESGDRWDLSSLGRFDV